MKLEKIVKTCPALQDTTKPKSKCYFNDKPCGYANKRDCPEYIRIMRYAK